MKTLKILTGVAFVVILSAFVVRSINPNKIVGSGYGVGDIADDISLKNIDGKMVSYSDYTDAKGFIVIFTCNTCPFSVANEDRIIALDAKYKNIGYPVIAINPNNPASKPGDSFEAMKQRAKEKGFTFPYLVDEGQKVYPMYGATKTPHVYLLQKTPKGNEVKYIGAIDDNSRNASAVKVKYLENAVDALLSGKTIKVTETKAIGCSIKA
ncbi:thioredoxin family protein [Dokdonia pacifica]|uniref:AhpC/TSA family protein n=1 Tax=Dokdonia pacifica TaxID=1627892 RepID=A0A239BGP8_9FLAO|nr:thioredoxin family protein [Dokdonia pacifica]GGG29709.1 thioredoxin family protein [Dokdonia pacifica]SNS06621.1 AhpC/TSA family protein [Dokdonia pacifica]